MFFNFSKDLFPCEGNSVGSLNTHGQPSSVLASSLPLLEPSATPDSTLGVAEVLRKSLLDGELWWSQGGRENKRTKEKDILTLFLPKWKFPFPSHRPTEMEQGPVVSSLHVLHLLFVCGKTLAKE